MISISDVRAATDRKTGQDYLQVDITSSYNPDTPIQIMLFPGDAPANDWTVDKESLLESFYANMLGKVNS